MQGDSLERSMMAFEREAEQCTFEEGGDKMQGESDMRREVVVHEEFS